MSKDWKLRLRYGKDKTPYHHFTALAEGRVRQPMDGYTCPVGPAWMSMKTWALDTDQSADMLQVIGSEIGFEVTGYIQVFSTDPQEPPRDDPYGYDVKFTPFDEGKD